MAHVGNGRDFSSADIFDAVVVGGGVTGGAVAWGLAAYTNVKRVAMLEKNPGVAMVNSHPLFNAQTRHNGARETNYPLEKALKVRTASVMMDSYVFSKNDRTLSMVNTGMVLAVTAQEVLGLEKRYQEFKPYYPDLELAYAKRIAELEPNVMEGRDPNQPVCALVDKAVAINYQRLAQHFVTDATRLNSSFEPVFCVEVQKVTRRSDGLYLIETNKQDYLTRTIIFAAGAYSLQFAHQMGYGKELGILSVKGDFWSAGEYLDGKVYRPQVEGRPFAELHADADFLNKKDTRFGPTTEPVPLMEAYSYLTFFDYIRQPLVSFKGLVTLLKILLRNKLVGYVAENYLYKVPVIGKLAFLRKARLIIPTLRYCDLKRRKRAGGVRPQIVNLATGQLEMGDKTIVGDNVIYNTTPSPGASVCLYNAKRDAAKIVEFLGPEYRFDKSAWERDLEGGSPVTAACAKDPHICPGV